MIRLSVGPDNVVFSPFLSLNSVDCCDKTTAWLTSAMLAQQVIILFWVECCHVNGRCVLGVPVSPMCHHDAELGCQELGEVVGPMMVFLLMS